MAMDTKFRAAHFNRAVELLGAILNGHAPADKQMERYFRAHREMGARDRGHVAEAVYACLRRRRELEYWADSGDSQAIVLAYLLRIQRLDVDTVAGLDRSPSARETAEQIQSRTPELPIAVRANLPDALWSRLTEQLGADEAFRVAQAMNAPAPVDLRVNSMRISRDALRDELRANGFDTVPTPLSPWGLRRHDRRPLFSTDAFQRGAFEIQDEGSQLISMVVDPKPGERIVDFCAGGGGKTLHLGMLMQGKGTLYAFDVNSRRLSGLKPRLRRSGLDNVRTQWVKTERDPHIKRLRGTIDRVLVDAPCSGLGTLRRNPDLKWKTIDFAALTTAQRDILAAAAELVKPGGRLVYATCSILNQENDAIVREFLASHADFEPVTAEALPPSLKGELLPESIGLTLYPHVHGTDGFYMCALQRRKPARDSQLGSQ